MALFQINQIKSHGILRQNLVSYSLVHKQLFKEKANVLAQFPLFCLNRVKMTNELIIGLYFKRIRSKSEYFLPVLVTVEKCFNYDCQHGCYDCQHGQHGGIFELEILAFMRNFFIKNYFLNLRFFTSIASYSY